MNVMISFAEYQVLIFLLAFFIGWFFGTRWSQKTARKLMRCLVFAMDPTDLPPEKDSLRKRIWKFITKKRKVTKLLKKVLWAVGLLLFGFMLSVFLTGCSARLVERIAGVERTGEGFQLDFSQKPEMTVVYLDGSVSMGWAEKLEKAFKKKNIGVMAIVKSGGGSVMETKLVHHAIVKMKQKYGKPLFVFTERGMYSGAYWVFACADYIAISPSTMTGSIGVFSIRIDLTDADSIAGIKYHIFKSGKNKAMWFWHDTLTMAQKEILQRQVDIMYEEFLDVILYYRTPQIQDGIDKFWGKKFGIEDPREYLEIVCDGRTYTAMEAFYFGFVDGVYYFDELKDFLKVKTQVQNMKFKDLDGDEVGDYLVYEKQEDVKKEKKPNKQKHPYTIYVGY